MTTDVTLNGSTLSLAVPGAIVLDVRRRLLGERRDRFVDVPGRAGSLVFAEQPGDRSLRLHIDIAADTFTERRAAMRALADWADTPSGRVRLIVDDEPDRYYNAVIAAAPDPDEWLTAADVELDYRIGPYAFAVSTSSDSVTATPSAASGTVVVDDTVVAYPVFELTAVGGTLTGIDFTFSGDTIGWTGSRSAGQTLTVSSITDAVTLGPNGDLDLAGIYDPDDVATMQTVTGTRFPLIIPGANPYTLTYTGTATAVVVAITWRPRYR